MDELNERLEAFRSEQNVRGKGALATLLFVTRTAGEYGLPLDASMLRTEKKGQVKRLSKSAVQSILGDYGIVRVLAQEGGRTSRGSLGLMETYVTFLNRLHEEGLADLGMIEAYWVEQVLDFFASKPLVLKYDVGRSLQSLLKDLLVEVRKRERETTGATYVGAVLQHLVGAKLELAMPDLHLEHHGASVADAPLARDGDFLIDNIAIHVTTAPSHSLMEKCQRNIESGLTPVIVTLAERVELARGNAEMVGIGERVDVFAAEQFLAANLYELGGFQIEKRRSSLQDLVDRYNEIVDQCETDPGLRIQLGQ